MTVPVMTVPVMTVPVMTGCAGALSRGPAPSSGRGTP